MFGGTGYVKRVDKVVNDAVEKDHTRKIPPEIVAENDKIKGGDKNKGEREENERVTRACG